MNKEVARVILIFLIGSYHVSLSKQDPINEESMIWQVNPFSKSTFRNQFKKLYPNEVSIYQGILLKVAFFEIEHRGQDFKLFPTKKMAFDWHTISWLTWPGFWQETA